MIFHEKLCRKKLNFSTFFRIVIKKTVKSEHNVEMNSHTHYFTKGGALNFGQPPILVPRGPNNRFMQ